MPLLIKRHSREAVRPAVARQGVRKGRRDVLETPRVPLIHVHAAARGPGVDDHALGIGCVGVGVGWSVRRCEIDQEKTGYVSGLDVRTCCVGQVIFIESIPCDDAPRSAPSASRSTPSGAAIGSEAAARLDPLLLLLLLVLRSSMPGGLRLRECCSETILLRVVSTIRR